MRKPARQRGESIGSSRRESQRSRGVWVRWNQYGTDAQEVMPPSARTDMSNNDIGVCILGHAWIKTVDAIGIVVCVPTLAIRRPMLLVKYGVVWIAVNSVERG